MVTPEQEVTNYHTLCHIERVRNLINAFVVQMLHRAELHDQSKLQSPEVELFTEYTSKLAGTTYGSPEYEEFRKKLKPALDHHYANNSHHPEHHKEVCDAGTAQLELDINVMVTIGQLPEMVKERLTQRLRQDLLVEKSSLNNMTLQDVVEMFLDWYAASERHNDGNVLKSIEINRKRFGMSTQLVCILENTAKAMGFLDR